MRFAHRQLTAFAMSAALLLAGLVSATHFHPHSHECGCGDRAVSALDLQLSGPCDHAGHHHESSSDRCCNHSHAAIETEQPTLATRTCCSAGRDGSPTNGLVADDLVATDLVSGQDSKHENSTPPHHHDDCVICQLLAQANAVAVPTFDISLIENVSLTIFSIPVSATTTPVVRYDVRGPPAV